MRASGFKDWCWQEGSEHAINRKEPGTNSLFLIPLVTLVELHKDAPAASQGEMAHVRFWMRIHN